MSGYMLEEWQGVVQEGSELVAQIGQGYWELGDLAIKVSNRHWDSLHHVIGLQGGRRSP